MAAAAAVKTEPVKTEPASPIAKVASATFEDEVLSRFAVLCNNPEGQHVGDYLVKKWSSRKSDYAQELENLFLQPWVAEHLEGSRHTTLVPQKEVKAMLLRPWQLGFEPHCKNNLWPYTVQMVRHFKVVMKSGFLSHVYPLEVYFPGDSNEIANFSVQYVAGWCRGLIVHTILDITLDLLKEKHALVDQGGKLIATMYSIQATYKPRTLREIYIDQMSSQNVASLVQKPSLVEVANNIVLIMREVKKHNTNMPGFEALNTAIKEYNGGQRSRVFMLTGDVRAAVTNIASFSDKVKSLIQTHYMQYKHSESALPTSTLTWSVFRLGSTCLPEGVDPRSCPSWVKRLTITEASVELCLKKMMKMFCKDVRPDTPKTMKIKAQITESHGRDVMRIACLWISMADEIVQRVGSEKAKFLNELFDKGSFDMGLKGAACSCDPEFSITSIPGIKQCEDELTRKDLIQASQRARSSAMKAKETAYASFLADLTVDQLAFKNYVELISADKSATKERARATMKEVHTASWNAIEETVKNTYPVFCFRTCDMWSQLPAKLNEFEDGLAPDTTWVYWMNLVVLGSVQSMKVDWACDVLSDKLTAYPNNSVGIVILNNRGAEDHKKVKKEQGDDEEGSDTEAKQEDSGTEAAEVDDNEQDDNDMATRKMQHLIEMKLSEHARMLKVKDFTVAFKPGTVYGYRKAVHPCLFVTSNRSTNIFRKCNLARRGLIQDVSMIPRAQMRRPTPTHFSVGEGALPQASLNPITLVGEGKQHLGGVDLVEKILEQVLQPMPSSVAIIDLYGFDYVTAEYAIKQSIENPRIQVAAATICHDLVKQEFCIRGISNILHAAAKTGALKLPGFPDVAQAMANLRANINDVKLPTLKVCLVKAGNLIVQRRFHEMFETDELTGTPFSQTLDTHNKEFNQAGIEEEAEASPASSGPLLLMDTECKSMEDLEGKGTVRTLEMPRSMMLATEETGECLYVLNKSDESNVIEGRTELFGFGSGSWALGSDAADLMKDDSRPWFRFDVKDPMDTMIILEQDGLPGDCSNHSKINTVMTLHEAMQTLEECGVMGTELINHKMTEHGFESFKEMVFYPKDKNAGGRKAKKPRSVIQAKKDTFGAPIWTTSCANVKANRNLLIIWRVRYFSAGKRSELAPVRPVCVNKPDIVLQGKEMIRIL